MSERAPEGTRCAHHIEVQAAWTCRRCGAFFCTECERRTRAEALPMCPKCWDLRSERVEKPGQENSQRLRIAGLILGVVALIPGCWIVQIAAIIVNILGIVRGRKRQIPREALNIAGLVLGILGLLFSIGIVVFAIISEAAQ